MQRDNWIQLLLFGQPRSRRYEHSHHAVRHIINIIKQVWNNELHSDFGIERIARLVVACLLLLSLGLHIKSLFANSPKYVAKSVVDLYVISKLLLPVLVFGMNWFAHPIVVWISCYMIAETLVYVVSLIYLSHEYSRPISDRRSFTLLIINYVQIVLDFAVIYHYLYLSDSQFLQGHYLGRVSAVYFSFVTSATIGFGDITPHGHIGKIMVMIQAIVFVLFVTLFLSYFGSQLKRRGEHHHSDTPRAS